MSELWAGHERRKFDNDLIVKVALIEQKLDLTLDTINERFDAFSRKFDKYNNLCPRTEALETKTNSIQSELTEHKSDSKDEKKDNKENKLRTIDIILALGMVVIAAIELFK